VGATVLPVNLGTLTTTIKVYFVQDLVTEFILGAHYLYALRAIMDFDHEGIRLHYRTIGMRATVDFTIQHKPGKDNVVPAALSRVIFDFAASNHTRRTSTSEPPIATLTPVLELESSSRHLMTLKMTLQSLMIASLIWTINTTVQPLTSARRLTTHHKCRKV
jgi:hypothetical protein